MFRFVKVFCLVSLALVFFLRCSSVKSTVSPLVRADAYMTSEDYHSALALYKQSIAQSDVEKQPVGAAVLEKALLAAYRQNEFEIAIEWVGRLQIIRSLTGEEVKLFAECVGAVEDPTLQLDLLTRHSELMMGYLGEEAFCSRLCNLCGVVGDAGCLSDHWVKADEGTKLKWFTTYYTHVKDSWSAIDLMSLCDQVLAMDQSRMDALATKAILLYEKNENRYKQLMDGYNKSKNATSYAYLKRDLKYLSADYRNCRDMFEKLHSEFPQERIYIQYLTNVYIRLEMHEKAKQLQKLL